MARRLALLMNPFLALARATAGDLDEGARAAEAAFEQAEASGLLYLRTEARRVLGVIRVMQERTEEAIPLFESVVALTEGTDAKVSRLWNGPSHVEALRALGRHDEADKVFEAYAVTVAACQAPHFAREVERLRARS